MSQIENSALRNLPKNVQQTVKLVLKLLLTISALDKELILAILL
jgi:hypothetical protein